MRVPNGRLETLRDCEDIVCGGLFMGTGGGGDVEWGMGMLLPALDEDLDLTWVDVDDIPDTASTATCFGMGSIAPMGSEVGEAIAKMHIEDRFGDNSMAEAVKELGRYLGDPIGCLVAGELGAGNVPASIVTAARLGIPLVDGDYAGRAIPDEMQTMPYLEGKNSWPLASVDQWGNTVIVAYTVNPHMLERIGKMLAVAAFTGTTMASTVLPAPEMKEIVVRGTITKSLAIGRAIRAANESGDDPVDAALAVTGGWRLFEGTVVKKDWEDRDGYMFGTVEISGSGSYEGDVLRVWFKNENHVTWLNGEPWVCSPDLVTIAHRSTGEGTTSTEIAEGDHVVAVGMRGLEQQRTTDALDGATGPRYYGFDIDYVPIEQLMEQR
ncbi:MAG: DUF917 domain-containing protein [Actinomycetia bacterium]|nr:DUF917 domain-containing protein [Actinomycetes bacterium]